ncbi:unnamed protein product [Boreogadus saida]
MVLSKPYSIVCDQTSSRGSRKTAEEQSGENSSTRTSDRAGSRDLIAGKQEDPFQPIGIVGQHKKTTVSWIPPSWAELGRAGPEQSAKESQHPWLTRRPSVAGDKSSGRSSAVTPPVPSRASSTRPAQHPTTPPGHGGVTSSPFVWRLGGAIRALHANLSSTKCESR